MSTAVSVFIFFLFLSLHACDARQFGVINKGSINTVQFHLSGEVDQEKVKLLDHINSSIGEGAGGDGDGDGDGFVDESHYNREATTQESKEDSLKKLSSGHVPIKPLVPVRVKNQDKGRNPGFFSDYSQPRTRAPSHN